MISDKGIFNYFLDIPQKLDVLGFKLHLLKGGSHQCQFDRLPLGPERNDNDEESSSPGIDGEA